MFRRNRFSIVVVLTVLLAADSAARERGDSSPRSRPAVQQQGRVVGPSSASNPTPRTRSVEPSPVPNAVLAAGLVDVTADPEYAAGRRKQTAGIVVSCLVGGPGLA